MSWLTARSLSSYGGHYVPQISWTVFNGNKARPHSRIHNCSPTHFDSPQNSTQQINIKGMLVGNPWTDGTHTLLFALVLFVCVFVLTFFADNIDSIAVPEFVYYHALGSYSSWTVRPRLLPPLQVSASAERVTRIVCVCLYVVPLLGV